MTLTFRRGHRVKVYDLRDKIREKAIRAAMRRWGWVQVGFDGRKLGGIGSR